MAQRKLRLLGRGTRPTPSPGGRRGRRSLAFRLRCFERARMLLRERRRRRLGGDLLRRRLRLRLARSAPAAGRRGLGARYGGCHFRLWMLRLSGRLEHRLDQRTRRRLGRQLVVGGRLSGSAAASSALARSSGFHRLFPAADEPGHLTRGDGLAALILDLYLPHDEAPSGILHRPFAVQSPARADRVPGPDRALESPCRAHEADRRRHGHVDSPEPGGDGGDQCAWHDRLPERAHTGVLGIRVQGVVVTREADERGQVCLGDGPSPRGPLAAERQVFEMNEFQDVLRCLC